MRDKKFLLIALFSLALFCAVTLWWNRKESGLGDQQAAERWSEEGGCAQVSAFMTREAAVDEFQIKSFEKQMEASLSEAAVTGKNENARLYIDAYSSQGRIAVAGSQGTLETDAIGVGGDFFFFHPLQLVSGRYFSGGELMQDFIILDEEAAWQLFGSSDIEGMSVMISGVPHYVAGVVKREKGHLAENAGLQKSVIYVSTGTLSQYGDSEGICCYEIVAPNPVKKFVSNTVREKFGLKEEEMTVVENSSRYSLEAMLPVMLDFGTRSMQNAAVHLPYWENMARGYEDIRAAVLFAQTLLLLIPAVILLAFLVKKWKNRKCTWKEIQKIWRRT